MKLIYNGERDKRTYKETIGATIQMLSQNDPDIIYLDADLMSCISMLDWSSENPDKGINCGVAEANMIGVAAGLSASGFKPIVHTFGVFASRRCYDQVFLSGGYAKNNLTIIGTDPGVCAAFNGGTHMPFEDVALYRAIPSSTVIDITDIAMFKNVLKNVVDMPGIKYIRVGRNNPVAVFDEDSEFEIGKGLVLKEGNDAVVFASGIMVHEALNASETLKAEGIDISVINIFTIKPLDSELVAEYAKRTGAAVTAENHNKIGGLYSAVCEALAGRSPAPVEYVAVEDEFGEVGPMDYLQKRFGLTSDNIVKKVKKAISRKHAMSL